MNIEFVETDHSYRLDGRPVDSVTTILKEEGYIDDTWFRDDATERGTYVHGGTELLDDGIMELSDYEGTEIYPYLEAWDRFRNQSRYKVLKSEFAVGSTTLGYAGTVDRLMEDQEGEQLILDIKSGQHSAWHGLQLAAYHLAFIETFGYDVSRVRVIHLKKTGKYSVCDEDRNIGKYDSTIWDHYWKTIISGRNLRERFREA